MGLEDIVYDLIKEFRASKADKQKQNELAKLLAKKAFLRFNFEWNTEKNTDVTIVELINVKHELFKHYSQVFLDIAVEIYNILPEESEKLKNMAKGMKSGALNRDYRDLISIGDHLADTALKNFHDLDNTPNE